MSIPDEKLMAYADGELDAAEHAAERAQIESAIQSDPAVAHRVEAHRALRRQVRGAFNAVLDEPVPERLLAAVRAAPTATRESGITDLGRVRAARTAEAGRGKSARPAWSWAQWGAMAASLVLGAVIGHVAMQSRELGPITTQDGHLVAQAGLDEALSNQLASAQGSSGPVRIGVSFKTKAGEYCRTFVVQRPGVLSGLACREGGAWDVRTLVRADAGVNGGGYQQAGSEMPAAVSAAVEAEIAGDPLDAAAEAEAKTNGWK